MRSTRRITKAVRHPVLSAAVLAVMLAGSAAMTLGQENEAEAGPLVLKKQGSFFVGGEIIHTDAASGTPAGPFFFGGTNTGDIAVNQMYVRYQTPEASRVPVVLIHGGDLAGTCYETTPDGRMGWDEYFVRKHHSVYIPDQVTRARSGFDPTTINEVRLGARPASQLPNMFVIPEQVAWTLFRFGPTFGTPYPDEQFPVEAADQLAKQVIPDQNSVLPAINPTWTHLAALAVKARGAVLLGHSESGFYPEQAALIDPSGVKGMITIETSCTTTLSAQQLAILARIPTLVVFGDHLDGPSTLNWPSFFQSCQTFVHQLNAAGGRDNAPPTVRWSLLAIAI